MSMNQQTRVREKPPRPYLTDEEATICCTTPLKKRTYTESGFKSFFFNPEVTSDLLEMHSEMLGFERSEMHLRFGPWFVPGHGSPAFILGPESPKSPNTPAGKPRIENWVMNVDKSGITSEDRNTPALDHVTLWNQLKRPVWWCPWSDKKDFTPVGRYIVVRNISPICLALLCYTMYNLFDMNLILSMLKTNQSEAGLFNHFALGKFDNPRSMLVSLNYMTLFDKNDQQPKSWQLSSTVLGLALESETTHASLYEAPENEDDPLRSWHVLCVEACPDDQYWLPDYDFRESLNGPEAFLFGLVKNLSLMSKRTDQLIDSLSSLVQPPADAPFDSEVIEDMLFDDQNFTNSRRYFWASQTLDVVRGDIEHTIKTIEDFFVESIWEMRHPTIWPGSGEDDPRRSAWCNRLQPHREGMQREITNLRKSLDKIGARQRQIKDLFDNLYSMTSVRESRVSAEMARATVFQGRNIKLLTIVSLIYLPLSFVTSIFGMTNMPQSASYLPFGYTLIAICLPTYLLLAVLLPTQGLDFWKNIPNPVRPHWPRRRRHQTKEDTDAGTQAEQADIEMQP
ncbi:MAG: hypothetical protein M1828_005431 [Chrysothrix sp. TS-e1954]|nr:MAG: hypothetical protein M1828_005431 [Chrysothrix sp. TS-e1954]